MHRRMILITGLAALALATAAPATAAVNAHHSGQLAGVARSLPRPVPKAHPDAPRPRVAGTISPAVPFKVCAEEGAGHCIQASGGNNGAVSAHPANGMPNQQFNFFTAPGSPCAGGLSTSSCPFPHAPAGKQIVVIGGQDAENSGFCAAFVILNATGTLDPCNGGAGNVFVLDGHALESGLLGREQGGKTYLCEVDTNQVAVFNSFTEGACQWQNNAQ